MTAKPFSNSLAPGTSLRAMAHREPLGRREWLVPSLLILLSAAPVAGGAVRLGQLAGGAEITPDNARFFAAPVPVVLHIVSVTLYCVLGAFQLLQVFAAARPPGIGRPDGFWSRVG